MKKHFKFILLTSLCTMLTYGAHGMKEELSTSSILKSQKTSKLPSGYIHKRPIDQMRDYREAFDVVWGEQPDAKLLALEHVPGLFPILKNGFALVNDTLFKGGERIGDKIRKRYEDQLKVIWKLTKDKDNNGMLSSSIFQCINRELAILMQYYNNGERKPPIFGMRSERRKVEKFTEDLKKGTEPDLQLLQPYLKNIVFVIYANPDPKVKKRGLLPERFVEQYCHENYPAYIALFDVLSKPRKNTKRDPHYSYFNGTFTMLDHDYAHAGQTTRIMELMDKIGFPFRKYLQKIYKIAKKFKEDDKKTNDAIILLDGLFMLSHELPDDFINSLKDQKGKIQELLSSGKELEAFEMLIDEVIKQMQDENIKYPRRDFNYKVNVRDREYILEKARNSNEEPFLSVIRVSEKKARPFPIARDKDGKIIVATQNTPTESLTYLNKQELAKDSPEIKAAIDERRQRFSIALREGYQLFWDTFLKIVEANMIHEEAIGKE